MGIQSYRDLKVWQEGMNLAEQCYLVTRNFPKEELYGMISQIRRCSASIPANVAEGQARYAQGVGVRCQGGGNFVRERVVPLSPIPQPLTPSRRDLVTGEKREKSIYSFST